MCGQEFNKFAHANASLSGTNAATITIPQNVPLDVYCYIINASNASTVVLVEGTETIG